MVLPSSGRTTTFSSVRTISPFYVSGPVAFSRSGRLFLGPNSDDGSVALTDLAHGTVLSTIEGDGEPVTAVALTPDGCYAVVISRSLGMKVWEVRGWEEPEGESDGSDDAMSVSLVLVKSVKVHTSPIVCAAVDESGTLVATGAADGVTKVWDIRRCYQTHVFHGHSGLVGSASFFAFSSEVGAGGGLRLATGGEDGKVRVWDLASSASEAVLDGHTSVVRAVAYDSASGCLVTASRDKTVMLWERTESKNKGKGKSKQQWSARSTVPTLETIESVALLSNSRFATAGLRGRVRLWEIRQGRVCELDPEDSEDDVEEGDPDELDGLVAVVQAPVFGGVVAVRADSVLIFLTDRSNGLETNRKLSGTHDEIIDMAVLPADRLALATNTDEIRIVSTRSGRGFGSDVAHLAGHTDIVLALDVFDDWIATASKDGTARLWHCPADGEATCHSIYRGHAGSVGGVAIQKSSDSGIPTSLATGSTDTTVKVWLVPASADGPEPAEGSAKFTRRAHEKEINALAWADRTSRQNVFATASQDRTAKVWDATTGEVVATLRGHSRGVWAVRFGGSGSAVVAGSMRNSASLVITGAGDRTVKIWDLTGACLTTFEGHGNSVLKVIWLTVPTRDDGEDDDEDDRMAGKGRAGAGLLASAAADGLVKVWDSGLGECVATLDGHDDRVWALTERAGSSSKPGSSFDYRRLVLSGGADGVVTFWADTTSETTAKQAANEARMVEQDQTLDNLRTAGRLSAAVRLAISLERPAAVFAIFRDIIEAELGGSDLVDKDVDDEEVQDVSMDEDSNRDSWKQNSRFAPVKSRLVSIIQGLPDTAVLAVLLWARDWNAVPAKAEVGQRVLAAVLLSVPASDLVGLVSRVQGGKKRIGNGNVETGQSVGSLTKDADGMETVREKAKKVRMNEVVASLAAYSERRRRQNDEMALEARLLDYVISEME